MTDAELQAIRERYEAALICHKNTGEVPGCGDHFGKIAACWEEVGEDVPALLEAIDAAETLKENYYAMAIGLSAYLMDCAWPVRKKMDEELTAAETAASHLRDALARIQDYAGDSVAELHVAQELLDDIGKVAGKALKPEAEQGDTAPGALAPNPPNC